MAKRPDTHGGGWESQEKRDLRHRQPRARSEPRPDARPDRDTDEIREEMRNEESDGTITIHRDTNENTGITQRIADDPDLARLYRKIEHLKVRVVDDAQANANRILEAVGNGSLVARLNDAELEIGKLDGVLDALRITIAQIQSSMGIGRWVLGFVIVCALGSLGTVISTVWGKAEAAGEQTIRLQHLERDLESLRSSFFSRQSRASATNSEQSNSQLTIPQVTK
jgi:hypothetical protein